MRARNVLVGEGEPEMAQYTYRDMIDGSRDFWGYVDSESLGSSWAPDETAWLRERNAGCLATRSDGDRCTRPLMVGVPFCEFHIGDAARAMRAYVEGELKEQMQMERRWRLKTRVGADIDAGKIVDAETVLRAANQSVYFFLVPGRAVKIGHSTRLNSRLQSLRNNGGGAMAPSGLDFSTGYFAAVIGGGRAVEGGLHRSLYSHRIVGEWFALTAPVEAAIEVAREEQARYEAEAAA